MAAVMERRRVRQVFSTGQVAAICHVAPRTVAIWFDSGRLRGYRIPGSLDRRVPRANLIRFLKDHGMPLGSLEEEEAYRVLVIGTGPGEAARLAELLGADGYAVHAAADGFEAGIKMGALLPDAVVIDFGMGRGVALAIAAAVGRGPAFARVPVLALACEDDADPDRLLMCGFHGAVRRPFDWSAVAEWVRGGVGGGS